MNKITHLLLSLLFFSNTLFAQDIGTKEELMDIMSKETCDCVNKKDLDFSSNDSIKLELEYGLCIMESYGKHKKEADKLLEVSFDDDKSLENLGVEIALSMMTHCPDFMMKIAGDYAADEFEEAKEDIIMVGNVIDLEQAQFNIIAFKDTDDRTQKLIWLEYFEGEILFADFSKLKKKRVKVTYIEKEMYDPKINDYRNFKVIKKIVIL